MKKIYTLIAILSLSAAASAQKNVILTVQHKLGDSNFSYNTTNSNDVGSTFKFSRVEYYMSGFTIIHDGGIETPVTTDTYILTDAFMNAVQSLGLFNVTNVEGIKFHIGVDAPTNNEDPNQWPMSHPLAPQSPSMHWGWAAGYFFAAVVELLLLLSLSLLLYCYCYSYCYYCDCWYCFLLLVLVVR